MATRVDPEVQWIADFPQSELPFRVRDHGWRRGNVALLHAIWGSKFWALGGVKSKIEERFVECHMERRRPKKWLDSIEKPKRRIDLKEQRDRQTDRQNQRQKIIDF